MVDPTSYDTCQLIAESIEYDEQTNEPIEIRDYRKTVNFSSLLDRIAMDLPVYNIENAKKII